MATKLGPSKNDIPSVISPTITTGTSQSYIDQSALIATHASLGTAYEETFSLEKGATSPDSTREEIFKELLKSKLERIQRKISYGGFIAECADFVVVACWIPPNENGRLGLEKEVSSLDLTNRPIYSQFTTVIYQARAKHLFSKYGDRYWNLSIMARDPRKPHVPGGVRALMDPFIQRAKENGEAIWLEASNDHSRDVYLHFGFKVVERFWVGSCQFSCMILEPR